MAPTEKWVKETVGWTLVKVFIRPRLSSSGKPALEDVNFKFCIDYHQVINEIGLFDRYEDARFQGQDINDFKRIECTKTTFQS